MKFTFPDGSTKIMPADANVRGIRQNKERPVEVAFNHDDFITLMTGRSQPYELYETFHHIGMALQRVKPSGVPA